MGKDSSKSLRSVTPLRDVLELMLRKESPKGLGMMVVDREGKPVANPDCGLYLFSDVLVRLTYGYILGV